jgi:hypothetical protein
LEILQRMAKVLRQPPITDDVIEDPLAQQAPATGDAPMRALSEPASRKSPSTKGRAKA